MPRPAAIFVVRHGQRLDISDKSWHLTSPTPYDPPLTYGGWTQSRVLGTRIAGLLDSLEQQDSEHSPDHHDGGVVDNTREEQAQGPKKSKKKHKIIIHSSPFLRCIQTSVAISAGIAQYRPPKTSAKRSNSRSRSPHVRPVHAVRERSPRVPRLDTNTGGSSLAPPMENGHRVRFAEDNVRGKWAKTTLCVDAFLGEWLNPDYFENITSPPNSTMMVASAKAILLRRGDEVESTGPSARATRGFFPGGWGSPITAPEPRPDPFDDITTLGQALTRHGRASSQGSHPGPPTSPAKATERGAPSITPKFTRDSTSYTPPVPSYAISPDEPIPRGYCAHARDACVDIAYHWDSMREPQCWGDGGEYGEEWSAMHKRLRKGLLSMMNWYSTHSIQDALNDNDGEEDDSTELAIILVSHSADCNALLGALMDQPFLMNTEMSSLSMAVLKDTPESRSSPSPSPASPLGSPDRRSSIASGLSHEYEMQIVASTEHLRLDNNPSKPSPRLVPRIPEYRRRGGSHATGSSPLDSTHLSLGDPMRPVNSSLGSMRRSASTTKNGRVGSPISRPTTSSSTTSSMGLWSKPTTPAVEVPPPIAPKAENVDAAPTEGSSDDVAVEFRDEVDPEELDQAAPLRPMPFRQSSMRGLWSSGGPPPSKDRMMKRRWTVTERDQDA